MNVVIQLRKGIGAGSLVDIQLPRTVVRRDRGDAGIGRCGRRPEAAVIADREGSDCRTVETKVDGHRAVVKLLDKSIHIAARRVIVAGNIGKGRGIGRNRRQVDVAREGQSQRRLSRIAVGIGHRVGKDIGLAVVDTGVGGVRPAA